jgi:hypothetical protein
MSEGIYPMNKTHMLEGLQLAIRLVKKRLCGSTLLLNNDNSIDALVLYSLAYEEFGKALIIKDCIDTNKDGLSVSLFRGPSAHKIKMERARQYLPAKCSRFLPGIKLSNPSYDTETMNYKTWHGKDVFIGEISRPSYTTGIFTDPESSSILDEIAKMEFQYVDWDPRTNERHTHSDYSIHEVEQLISLFEEHLLGFAKKNSIILR